MASGGPGAWSDVRNKAGARCAESRKGVGARSDFGNGWSVERYRKNLGLERGALGSKRVGARSAVYPWPPPRPILSIGSFIKEIGPPSVTCMVKRGGGNLSPSLRNSGFESNIDFPFKSVTKPDDKRQLASILT